MKSINPKQKFFEFFTIYQKRIDPCILEQPVQALYWTVQTAYMSHVTAQIIPHTIHWHAQFDQMFEAVETIELGS